MERFDAAVFLVCASVVFAGACQRDPSVSGPGATQLQSRLATELPAYLRLTRLRVEASENVGDKVQPIFKSRFRGTVQLTAETFLQSAIEDGVVLLVSHLKEGVTRELFGVAVSKLSAGSWKTEFSFDNDPIPGLGRPRDFFPGGKVVVRGSAEETEWRTEQRRQREDAEQALLAQQREQELALQKRLEDARRETEKMQTEAQIEAEQRRAAAAREAELRKAQSEIDAQRRREDADRAAKEAAENEKRRQDAEETQKREAEARMRAWSSTTGWLEGTSDRGPVRLRFTSFDATGSFSAEIEGTSLKAVCPVRGKWVGNQIQAEGTGHYEVPQVGFVRAHAGNGRCLWKAAPEGPSRITGSFSIDPFTAFRVSFSK